MLSYSFLAQDGTERRCQGVQDLSSLIDSGAITPATFFWDDQTQRWLKATEFQEYVQAKEIVEEARTRRLQPSSVRPGAAVDFREPGIRNAKLLDYVAGNPHYLIHKAAIASRGLLLLGALFVSAILWQASLLHRLGSLVTQYGIDHVPTALIPGGLKPSMIAVTATQYVWYCGIVACLMYCFYQLYLVLRTCCGAKMKYSFGWTVGSLFIPVVFLYRPWAGLAEIRRKSIELRHNVATRGDWYTAIFAAAFFSLVITTLVANGEISRLVPKAGGVGNLPAVAGLELLEAGAVTAMTVFCYYYCRGAVMAVREIMLRKK
jgi:hypothetical protein